MQCFGKWGCGVERGVELLNSVTLGSSLPLRTIYTVLHISQSEVEIDFVCQYYVEHSFTCFPKKPKYLFCSRTATEHRMAGKTSPGYSLLVKWTTFNNLCGVCWPGPISSKHSLAPDSVSLMSPSRQGHKDEAGFSLPLLRSFLMSHVCHRTSQSVLTVMTTEFPEMCVNECVGVCMYMYVYLHVSMLTEMFCFVCLHFPPVSDTIYRTLLPTFPRTITYSKYID